MAQQISDKDEPLNEVNVIPLADLSLVLLIILMVMSPMISQALIQVSAAKAAAAQTQEELAKEKPETPVIVSFAPGILKLNGVTMGSDLEFVTHLDQIMPNRRDKSVILTAAPDLTHGKVVRLMDVVKRHGAETLILVKWDPTRQTTDHVALIPNARTSRGRHS
jgi:biopolymer transport protein ExbD